MERQDVIRFISAQLKKNRRISDIARDLCQNNYVDMSWPEAEELVTEIERRNKEQRGGGLFKGGLSGGQAAEDELYAGLDIRLGKKEIPATESMPPPAAPPKQSDADLDLFDPTAVDPPSSNKDQGRVVGRILVVLEGIGALLLLSFGGFVLFADINLGSGGLSSLAIGGVAVAIGIALIISAALAIWLLDVF